MTASSTSAAHRRLAKMMMTAALTAALAGCGGGGDGGGGTTPPPPPPPAPSSFTLGGSIRAADVTTVDSDTNDPNQTGFSANDTPTTAQVITSPITVVGAVNLVRQGPTAGRNYTVGDEYDWFSLPLKAGQVVELFVGLPSGASNDADLCVVSTNAQNVACSVSTTQRECVRAVADGDYYVVVAEFSSASVYNLRISAPGAGVPCEVEVAPADAMVPGQLLASHRRVQVAMAASAQRQQRAQTQALARAGGAAVLEAVPQGLAVDVVQLPLTAGGRPAALAALAALDTRRAAAEAPALRKQVQAAERGAAPEVPQAQELAEAVAFFRYAKALQAIGGYAAVEPNWLMDRTAAPVGLFPPADDRYSSQRWHYEQIGLPAAMDSLRAMSPQPTQRPVVAVLDDGVMLDHPDLAPQLTGPGRSFASNSSTGDGDVANGETVARSSDDSFHGSHVAGTAVAATFDSGGTSFGAGVAPMAQLMAVRVFRNDGRASSLDVAEGIRYAAGLANRSGFVPTRRADVINMSLGSSTYVPCPSVYQDAISAARAAGVVVVVAAGNSGRNDLGQAARVSAPANCTGAWAVSATEAQRRLSYYSNTGTELAIAAPGGDTSQRSNGSGSPDGVFSAWGAFQGGTRLASFKGIQGTSMASPHVAGVVALMRWVNPALTPAQMDTLLAAGQLTDDIGTAGRDTSFGFGLVNARKAVDAARSSLGGTPPPVLNTPVVASPSTLDFGASATQLALRIAAAGTTNERVLSVADDSPAVTVSAAAVDANGLGDYTVRVDRSRVPAGAASYFPRITVQLSPTRSFSVQLAFTTAVGGMPAGGGNVGPLYVLVLNPDTNAVRQVRPTFTNGRYSWQITGYTGSRAIIAAGSDLDNDGLVCQLAEVCGGYPILSTDDAMTIDITANRGDLDFTVEPSTDSSAAALAAGSGSTAVRRWQRRP
jgi:serine protease